MFTTLNFPWDSLKAKASLKPIKSFCKNGIGVVVSSLLESLFVTNVASGSLLLLVKLVNNKKPSVIPKFLVKFKVPINYVLSV